jgi:RNA polymerase sigma-70 factor (ECF subfamily)
VSTVPAIQAADVTAPFREHERYLWGLCYRLTGSAAEADDLVQDTFVRALERPPARRDEPWRPWLTCVALNLGRDALRRRRRRAYVGPWLPSPVETGTVETGTVETGTVETGDEPPSIEIEAPDRPATEARYDLLESVSFAFLLALEALTPQQRAVLILRDVFDYSVKETAAALSISEPSVKTTHHRARRALEPYDHARSRATPELAARAKDALHRFLHGLATADVAAVEALLTEDARALSDGAGEFAAARRPILGRARVARLYLGLMRRSPAGMRMELRMLNGLPALVAEQPSDGKTAPRLTLQCAVDAEGRITTVYSVLATRKLTAVRGLAAAG